MAESALATIPNVPIVTVGTWDASTGPFSPTRQWCMDAVSAFHDDPGIIAPRTWAGHRPEEMRAGEPALGVFSDMRWSEDDLTIYADILTLRSIAEAAPVLFPNRSIEAWSNFQSPATGRVYEGVIDGLALLGVEWPAVPVLEDLNRLATGDLSVLTITEADALTERIAASANARTEARRVVAAGCWTTREDADMAHRATTTTALPAAAAPVRVAAQVEMDAVWRAFYDWAEEAGHPWWWIRADLADPLGLIVQGDDELLRMDVTIAGNDITFGEPTAVVVQYVDKDSGGEGGDAVAASAGKPLRIAAAHANASATRPATNTEDDMDEAQLREAVGMPDAPIEDVLAAVREKFGTAGGTTPAGTGDAADGDGTTTTEGAIEGDPATAPATTPAAPVDASGNPLVVTVDADRLRRLEAAAARGENADKVLAAQDRDATLTRHAARGAIGGKASKAWAAWSDALDKDPTGAKALMETLASGKVPVDGEVGSGVDPGAGNAGAHTPEAHAARMAMHGHVRATSAAGTSAIPTDTKGA